MKNVIFALLCMITSLSAATDIDKRNIYNNEIKKKILTEVGNLEASLSSAKNEITQLRQDKINIDNSLTNMESWGKQQELDKNTYYSRVLESEQKLADIQSAVDTEKEKAKATLDKYHRVKSLLGYAFGVVVSYTYIVFLSPLFSSVLIAVAGPWGILLRFGCPAAAFGLGYATIYMLF